MTWSASCDGPGRRVMNRIDVSGQLLVDARTISCSSDGFTADRASSRISTRGRATSARESATRWR